MIYRVYRYKANGFRATPCDIQTDNIEDTRKLIREQYNTSKVLLYYETDEPFDAK